MRTMKEEQGLGSNRKGFTLIELMVALVLSFILVGAVYRTFTVQQKSYTIQDQIAETQQNARMAMNILLRDIRMAGYGMPDGGITIGSPAKTYSNAIQITEDGNKQDYDSITLVGAFGAPSGYLNRTLSPGSTELYLRSSTEASHFDADDNKYIFIGGLDSLTILSVSGNKITLNGNTKVRYPTAILSTGVDSGDTDLPVVDATGLASGDVLSLGTETITITAVSPSTLTVDTDLATAGNQGLNETYPAGTIINPVPVFRVTVVEYSIDNSDIEHPVFTREDRAVGTVSELAGSIKDIQIAPDNLNDQTWYTLTLTARTRKPDANYQQNGGFRQRVLESRVALRNL
jgi:prepilin-type N-terminal cleavage/methylation domain-containing protein